MCFHLISKNQCYFICISLFSLLIIDIIYINFTPQYFYTHPSVIKIENVIRIIFTSFEFSIAGFIFLFNQCYKNESYSVYLNVEIGLSILGLIFSFAKTVLQWIVTLHNTFFTIMLIKAQKKAIDKYVTPFQIILMIVFGNIICDFSGIVTINWFFMRKDLIHDKNSTRVILHDNSYTNNKFITLVRTKGDYYVINKDLFIWEDKINLKRAKFIVDQFQNKKIGNFIK